MSNKGEKNTVIIQGSILAAASLVVRFIGLIYRIPMARIIGDTGLGYYSTAFQVYNVILLLSSYSMPQALSKLMAGKIGRRQYRNANRYFLCSLSVSALSGAIFGGIMYWGSGFIAGTILHAQMAEYSLRVLAPTVFIMSFLGVFRGYFQGYNNMVPTAISQIFEQIINAVVSIVGAYVLFRQGMRVDLVKGSTDVSAALGAKGGTLGTLWGAITALAFMVFLFVMFYPQLLHKMKKEPKKRVYSYKRVYKEIYGMMIPIVISTFIFHVLNLIDNGIYNSYMMGKNVSEKEYMAIWGVYSGKYQLLINLPIALATALASSLIPQLTRAVELRDKGDIYHKIDSALKFTMMLTVPSMFGLGVLGGDMIKLLFGNSTAADGGRMLLLGGSAVVLYAYATISNGILHGLGKMYTTVKNALIALGIHIVSLYVLLYLFGSGITGVIISYIIFGLAVTILNNYSIYLCSGYKGDAKKFYLWPCVSSLLMSFIVYGVNFIVSKSLFFVIGSSTISSAAGIILSVAAGVIVYFVAILALHVVDEAELLDMPFGRKMIRFGKKLNLL